MRFNPFRYLSREKSSQAAARGNSKKNRPDTREIINSEVIDDQSLGILKSHMLPITLFDRLNAISMGLIFVSCFFLVILIVEHISLYPLVEHQYIYAEFIGSEHNYVNVAHTKELHNERLIESLLRRYVIEREQIVREPSNIVESFSTKEVFDIYFNQVLRPIADRRLRNRLRRLIKINRYQVIESNVRQFEVEFTDLIKFVDEDGNPQSRLSKSQCLINIKFIFDDVIRRVDEVKVNPAGLFVSAYQIKRIR